MIVSPSSDASGQLFTPEALKAVWELTLGQPWLVNGLGYVAVTRMKENRDRTRVIDQAKENLILRRETHLDQLADKSREEHVGWVIEPILAGQSEPEQIPQDDIDYPRNLGLIET